MYILYYFIGLFATFYFVARFDPRRLRAFYEISYSGEYVKIQGKWNTWSLRRAPEDLGMSVLLFSVLWPLGVLWLFVDYTLYIFPKYLMWLNSEDARIARETEKYRDEIVKKYEKKHEITG